jgi:hypothetical protein
VLTDRDEVLKQLQRGVERERERIRTKMNFFFFFFFKKNMPCFFKFFLLIYFC